MPGAYYLNTTSLIMLAPVTTSAISFSVPTSMKSMGRELARIGRKIFQTTGNRHLSDSGGRIVVRIMTECQAGARRTGEARVAIDYIATTDRTQLGFLWPTADGAVRMVAVEMSHYAEGGNLL
jgi:hypothetical protein